MIQVIVKYTISLALVFLAVSGSVIAQESEIPGVTVNTDPPGALVTLSGAATLSGLSPVFFSQGIPGIYDLKVSRRGYESYHSKLVISANQSSVFSVRLKAKTRIKAAIRSMFWPGWGQFYSGHSRKGLILSGLTLAAGAAVVIAEVNYQTKRDAFDVVNESYQRARSAGSYEDLLELQPQLAVVQADAYDAETYRLLALGSAVTVWSIGVLDALLFSSDGDSKLAAYGMKVVPETNPTLGYTGLSLVKSF